MTSEQIEGLTKARLVCNLTRAVEDQFADNDAYAAFVRESAGLKELPERALASYVEQHADKSIKDLEAELAEKAAT